MERSSEYIEPCLCLPGECQYGRLEYCLKEVSFEAEPVNATIAELDEIIREAGDQTHTTPTKQDDGYIVARKFWYERTMTDTARLYNLIDLQTESYFESKATHYTLSVAWMVRSGDTNSDEITTTYAIRMIGSKLVESMITSHDNEVEPRPMTLYDYTQLHEILTGRTNTH